MGVNIHMSLVRDDGILLIPDLYDGRNYEWFDNLQQKGDNELYDKLPIKYGIPENVPPHILEDYNSGDYYEFHYLQSQEYILWFNKYRPDIDAGWITTYDKWRYENKGEIPELCHYLPTDANLHDMQFIEVQNPYNIDSYIMTIISNWWETHKHMINGENHNDPPHKVYLVYYFDC
jgi:hypothetical protein